MLLWSIGNNNATFLNIRTANNLKISTVIMLLIKNEGVYLYKLPFMDPTLRSSKDNFCKTGWGRVTPPTTVLSIVKVVFHSSFLRVNFCNLFVKWSNAVLLFKGDILYYYLVFTRCCSFRIFFLTCWKFCRFCTTGLPSDVVVEVGDMSFHLHKVNFFLSNLNCFCSYSMHAFQGFDVAPHISFSTCS